MLRKLGPPRNGTCPGFDERAPSRRRCERRCTTSERTLTMARLDVTSQQNEEKSLGQSIRPSVVADRTDALGALFDQLFCGVAAAPSVSLASGATIYRSEGARAEMVLGYAGVARDMFLAGSDASAAEAFIRGDLAINGDLESAIEALEVARTLDRK